MFKVRLDDRELRAKLEAARRRGLDTKPVLKQIGVWFSKKVPNLNWESLGARYMPGGWPELSPMTKAIHEWADKPADAILQFSGQLKNQGWSYQLRGDGVEAGTNTPHADKHQKGGWFAAPPSWERPMVRVPQRIVIAVNEQDMEQCGKFADDHIERAVPGATRSG